MRESEKWREVARLVAEEDHAFSAAVYRIHKCELKSCKLVDRDWLFSDDCDYTELYTLYALLLAEEAEEEEVEAGLKGLVVAMFPHTGGPTTTYAIPAPAMFAWTDTEPFPEEKEELKPAYIEGYVERRSSWSEKWDAFKARWF